MTVVNPESLLAPRGYSNGMQLHGSEVLFVAGQIGWDKSGKLVSNEMAPQFAQALDNVLAVVCMAGAEPDHIGRLTIYVTDKNLYRAAAKEIGLAYRARLGRHYPAMSLVQVAALLEDGALVEIEATAVLP